MNSDTMKAQGARCPCGGADDYCICQNVDLAAMREQQKNAAAELTSLQRELDEVRHDLRIAEVGWSENRKHAGEFAQKAIDAEASLALAQKRVEELEEGLKLAERRLVALYSGINPHANYDSDNRLADTDEIVVALRAILGDIAP